jgi:hypothetical protein
MGETQATIIGAYYWTGWSEVPYSFGGSPAGPASASLAGNPPLAAPTEAVHTPTERGALNFRCAK